MTFNFAKKIFGKKEESENRIEKDGKVVILNDAINNNDTLSSSQSILEHMCGSYDLINFINNELNTASNLKIEDNIIYLDYLSSKKFFIGPSFEEKYNATIFVKDEHGNKSKKRKEVVKVHNPFITCQYDFIHLVDWKIAYVYGDYLYLMANRKNVNSNSYKSMDNYCLAILCDNPNKFNALRDFNTLDFRKMIFNAYDKDETHKVSNEGQSFELVVENKVVEKNIPIMFLTYENSYLIKKFSLSKLEEEYETYISLNKVKAEDRMGKYFTRYQSIMEHYNINTTNQNQRDYEKEDKEYSDKRKAEKDKK